MEGRISLGGKVSGQYKGNAFLHVHVEKSSAQQMQTWNISFMKACTYFKFQMNSSLYMQIMTKDVVEQ